jgi:hypothetical protein
LPSLLAILRDIRTDGYGPLARFRLNLCPYHARPTIIRTVLDDARGFDPTDEEELDDELPPGRRAWQLWLVAAVAVAILAVPVWGTIARNAPQIADNGLQVCSYDYCDVEAAVDAAGHTLDMARLSGVFLEPKEAQSYADALTDHLGESAVRVEVVRDLPGSVAGRYDYSARLIQVTAPATAWIIVHEVAHTVASGHGPEFEEAITELLTGIEQPR